jgi:hypothetical protein
MLDKNRRQGTTAEIERLFLANAVMDCFGYPILLIQMTLVRIS